MTNFQSDADALCYLLECTLATYESLCIKRSSSKYEIDRHESMITKIVVPMYRSLREAHIRRGWHGGGRVRLSEVLHICGESFGDTPAVAQVEAALATYFAKARERRRDSRAPRKDAA